MIIPAEGDFRLDDEAATARLGAAIAAVLKAGHTVIAVGRSGDGDVVASQGIVNRAGGAWQTWLGGHVDRLVRLDGGVYDGLSGAPVADTQGAVVGMATAALSRSYGIVVPTATVTRVVDALLAHGRVARAWLGIGERQPLRFGTARVVRRMQYVDRAVAECVNARLPVVLAPQRR